MSLAIRYAKSMNAYSKEQTQKKQELPSGTYNLLADENNASHQVSSANLSKPKDINVLAECRKYEGTAGKARHILKLIGSVFTIIPTLIRIFRAPFDSQGGSSSSFDRGGNIKRNVTKSSEYIVKHAPDDEGFKRDYENIVTNNKQQQERSLYIIDENGNQDGASFKGKCICETTEIALYRTAAGSIISVERGMFNHQLRKGVMMYYSPADADARGESQKANNFAEFKELHTQFYELMTRTSLVKQEKVKNPGEKDIAELGNY